MTVDDILTKIGWPDYEQIQLASEIARNAYDMASDYGYPAAEAVELNAADAALAEAQALYPGAAAYAKAIAYHESANYRKVAAGKQAMDAIERGADPVEAVTAMERDWAEAASKMVDNS